MGSLAWIRVKLNMLLWLVFVRVASGVGEVLCEEGMSLSKLQLCCCMVFRISSFLCANVVDLY